MKLYMKILVGAIVCLAISLAGLGIAQYWIYSQLGTISVSSYSLNNFSVTPAAIDVGENVTMSVTLDVDVGQGLTPVPDVLIHFYQGDLDSGIEIGTAYTNPQGIATLEYTVKNYGSISFYAGYEVP
jgi:hypothetical protein